MKKGVTPSHKDVLKVFRVIANHFDENPELLQQDGVFRLSGRSGEIPKILKYIIKNGKLPKEGVPVNDLIGCLKKALERNVLLDFKDPHISNLKRALDNVDTIDPKSVHKAGLAISELILALTTARNKQDQIIAEILHTYIYLAHKASKEVNSNRMTPENLAVAAIGPLFYNNIMITNDPMELMSLTGKATPAAEDVIKSNHFTHRFGTNELQKQMEIERIVMQLEESLQNLVEQYENGQISQNVYDSMIKGISIDLQRRRDQISGLESPHSTSTTSTHSSGSSTPSPAASSSYSSSSYSSSSSLSSSSSPSSSPSQSRRGVHFSGLNVDTSPRTDRSHKYDTEKAPLSRTMSRNLDDNTDKKKQKRKHN
ncbi:hypothetical protein [Candidatus Berkiella aquae]|uniref:Rho-GAP domain-containing protein n=1 Tax=Candidatus Berkiella aquae TaxID=295108 RepID=A0A0Q9YY41_9GAMM|nr:hypothetical protein [Candidatus Berkiella aquae]MCS5710400.1 hypothetical protein [Candidatus Berkiella aquae]